LCYGHSTVSVMLGRKGKKEKETPIDYRRWENVDPPVLERTKRKKKDYIRQVF